MAELLSNSLVLAQILTMLSQFFHSLVRLFVAALVALPSVNCFGAAEQTFGPAKWESEIRAFENADRTNPPPANPIVFVGSSSIRLWKTMAEDFRGMAVLNRGFGGSQMEDGTFFAERIILPYRPNWIVVYAGDNDLASGKQPEQILADFQAFVRKVHASLPNAQIAYIAIKPSPSRWRFAAEMRQANRLITEFTQSDSRLRFVDIFTPMLGPDGTPRAELYLADKLHMTREGYALWTSLVRPVIGLAPEVGTAPVRPAGGN